MALKFYENYQIYFQKYKFHLTSTSVKMQENAQERRKDRKPSRGRWKKGRRSFVPPNQDSWIRHCFSMISNFKTHCAVPQSQPIGKHHSILYYTIYTDDYLAAGINFHDWWDCFSHGSDVVLHTVVDGRCIAAAGSDGMSPDDQLRHELTSFGYDEHGRRQCNQKHKVCSTQARQARQDSLVSTASD